MNKQKKKGHQLSNQNHFKFWGVMNNFGGLIPQNPITLAVLITIVNYIMIIWITILTTYYNFKVGTLLLSEIFLKNQI